MKKRLGRLPELLKRFRRLSQSTNIFATERQVGTFAHVHPKELRDMLLNELGFLREQHEQFSKLGRQTLKEIESVLKSAKDSDLREAMHECYLALQVMRRSLFRAELAGWETRALLDEWNEWMRAETFMSAEERNSLIKQERLELLRSELALRGVPLKRSKSEERVLTEIANDPSTEAARQEALPTAPGKRNASPSDFFEDWDEDYRNTVEKELAYWTDVKCTMDRHNLDGVHALPLLKIYKKVHGEKNLFKKLFAPRAFKDVATASPD